MDLLLKKTNPDQMKHHILPMILGALEANNQQVQVHTHWYTPTSVVSL